MCLLDGRELTLGFIKHQLRLGQVNSCLVTVALEKVKQIAASQKDERLPFANS